MHIIRRNAVGVGGRFAFGVVLAGAALVAQNLEREVRALRPASTEAREQAFLDFIQQQATSALNAIPHATTPTEAAAARPALRMKLEESLGFRKLPPPDPQPRTVGAIQRDGYRIEKLVWHSLPGVQVPGHLYLPAKLEKRAPAILFYTGHWYPDSKARPDFQAFCINMARQGFVVLIFDTFGQGERGISTRDHRRVELLLGGVSQQGLAEYETQCALAVLLARLEVDSDRIGMTGASGGGYNTWITTALDNRIKVAVPVVGTSDFLEQIEVARGFDWYHADEHCHFVPGLIRYANNHEFVAMVAPRPLLIVSASKDQSFPVTGVRRIAAYAHDLYTAYGQADRTAYFEDSTESHGYQKKKREAAYGWFLKWLMQRGDGVPFAEPPTTTTAWDTPEMRCFPPGQNQPSGPGTVAMARSLWDEAQKPPAVADGSFVRVENNLSSLPKLNPLHPALTDARVQRIEFESQPGILIPAFLARPEGAMKGVVIALDDRGKEALAADAQMKAALDAGWAVFGIDPRGIGESATSKMGWVGAVELLLAERLPQRQGFDLMRALYFTQLAFPSLPAGLYARGENASLAAAYALAAEDFRWYSLRGGFVSYRQFIDRPLSLQRSFELKPETGFREAKYDREIPFTFFSFPQKDNLLLDLPRLLESSKARGLVMEPIDGDWNPMRPEDARKLLPRNVRIGGEKEFADLLKK